MSVEQISDLRRRLKAPQARVSRPLHGTRWRIPDWDRPDSLRWFGEYEAVLTFVAVRFDLLDRGEVGDRGHGSGLVRGDELDPTQHPATDPDRVPDVFPQEHVVKPFGAGRDNHGVAGVGIRAWNWWGRRMSASARHGDRFRLLEDPHAQQREDPKQFAQEALGVGLFGFREPGFVRQRSVVQMAPLSTTLSSS